MIVKFAWTHVVSSGIHEQDDDIWRTRYDERARPRSWGRANGRAYADSVRERFIEEEREREIEQNVAPATAARGKWGSTSGAWAIAFRRGRQNTLCKARCDVRRSAYTHRQNHLHISIYIFTFFSGSLIRAAHTDTSPFRACIHSYCSHIRSRNEKCPWYSITLHVSPARATLSRIFIGKKSHPQYFNKFTYIRNRARDNADVDIGDAITRGPVRGDTTR